MHRLLLRRGPQPSLITDALFSYVHSNYQWGANNPQVRSVILAPCQQTECAELQMNVTRSTTSRNEIYLYVRWFHLTGINVDNSLAWNIQQDNGITYNWKWLFVWVTYSCVITFFIAVCCCFLMMAWPAFVDDRNIFPKNFNTALKKTTTTLYFLYNFLTGDALNT